MDLKTLLPEFQEFLRDRKLAPERSIPYYALWVKKFLTFINTKGPGGDAKDSDEWKVESDEYDDPRDEGRPLR